MRIGKADLDAEHGTLRIDGSLVPVRRKTFDLLVFLARNPGRVLSKDEFMEAVWPGVIVTEDSLTQCVRDARRMIGDSAQAVIRTVPKRGYIFVPADDPPSPPGANEVRSRALPTVAILPFRVDGRAWHGLAGDVIAEDVADALACFRTLAVVPWSSAFPAHAPASDVLAAVRARGVDYCVEGNLRQGATAEASISVTDVQAGRRTWARRLPLPAVELPDLPATVASFVASRVASTVEQETASRNYDRPSSDARAYAHLIRGRSLLRSYGDGVNEAARAEFRSALDFDPDSGLAAAYLAFSDVVIAGYQSAPREVLEKARDEAVQATLMSPFDARCQRILSTILTFLRQFAAAEHAFRRAYELNPHDPDTLAHIGFCCAMRGRPQDALEWLDRAVRINPIHADWYNLHRHIATYMLSRYDEAAELLERIPRRTAYLNARLAAAYAMAGRLPDAAGAWALVLEAEPDFDLDAFAAGMNLEHEADRVHFRRGMRLAADFALKAGRR